jgi:endonuclease III
MTRAQKINGLLKKAHPGARCALAHKNPLQLLIATILSAQCTDVRVNQVTPALFKKYPDAARLAKAPLLQLEQMVRATGFYRQKARSLRRTAGELVARFRGKVPRTLEELVTLPGVWRKTANVILGNCFRVPAVVVDTHVKRLAWRMGLTKESDPDKIERDLMKQLPAGEWTGDPAPLPPPRPRDGSPLALIILSVTPTPSQKLRCR